jgi:lipoate-protein ligase A
MKNLRLIRYSENDGFLNMAIDESLMSFVSKGASPATIRFYGWKPACVSIGFFQSISEEVNVKNARNLGVDIVRRYTGGGAVFHEKEITYSIILPEKKVAKDIIESYSYICQGIILGLEKLGIKAAFKPINDIVINNKKISGNAQTRKRGVMLQHGTILVDVDVEKMFSLLRVGKEKISDKAIDNAKERVTWLKRELDKEVDLETVENCLIEGFSEAMGCDLKRGVLSLEELKLALQFSKEKYSSHNWNFWR